MKLIHKMRILNVYLKNITHTQKYKLIFLQNLICTKYVIKYLKI